MRKYFGYWRLYAALGIPLLFSILFAFSTSKEIRCAFVILVMSCYWMTETLPLALTALMPVFAFPFLGILSSSEVCLVYMKETIMMFVGGLMVAIAVEHSNLHKRIALFVILGVGQSPRRLMAGFMLTTMFLSMWISNTASTAMMVPIVDAILQELYKTTENEKEGNEGNSPIQMEKRSRGRRQGEKGIVNQALEISEDDAPSPSPPSPPSPSTPRCLTAPPPNEECKALKTMYFLATAYAANIGGTGSLTGTGPNLVVKETLDSSFSDPTGLNFASWMIFNVPGMIICTFIGWVWLQFMFVGFGSKSRLPASSPSRDLRVKRMIRSKYEELGGISFHECVVLGVFVSLVGLWFFLKPGFMFGWADWFKWIFDDPKLKIGNATPAILASFVLFLIPSKPNFWASSKFPEGPSPRCLNWQIIHEKMPWGIVLLLGGGFAMAKASNASGLSVFLGHKLTSLETLPVSLSVLLLSIMTAMATEVASNTATASIIMPILREVALSLEVNPLYFMLPAAICCSYAFMLPVATPPNAIVFGAAEMKTTDMMKAGFVMNILCVLVINLMINTLGIAVFNVNELPPWVNSTVTLN